MKHYAIAFCLLCLFPCHPSAQAQWKAGVSKAVITPEQPVWLAGYGSKRVPDGKLHDLWLKVLALDDGQGHRAVLITSDFQGVPKSMSDRVFAKLLAQYQLARHEVMFTFSHNHCGPRLGDDLIDYYPVEAEQEQLVAAYTSQMVELTVATVGRALVSMQPVRIYQGQGTTNFAVNRRNNQEAEVAQLLAEGKPLAGPVDHAVPVMSITDMQAQPLAIVFGYACHPTTLSFTKWCGDYPGFAQLEIEQSLPTAQAMFINTCGGDQNPLPRRTVELCEKYGHMLAQAVDAALQAPMKEIAQGLEQQFDYVELDYLQVMDRAALEVFAQDSNAIRARWAQRLLKQLEHARQFESAYPYPIHVWRLGGDTLMIGMGAETVVDYALRLKRQYGQSTWVCGYSDDMISYIPSRRVWEEGGYEGGSNLYEYGRPALRWTGTIEERICEKIDQLVKRTAAQR